jgi:hypothetical protein
MIVGCWPVVMVRIVMPDLLVHMQKPAHGAVRELGDREYRKSPIRWLSEWCTLAGDK